MKLTKSCFYPKGKGCLQRSSFILLFFILIGFTSFAQEEIRGKVVDNNFIPIAGVSVKEKDVQNGVITDFDGDFNLTTTTNDAVLVFSYMGFETQELQLNDSEVHHIVMQENLEELKEVVIIGFGTQNREEVTAAIATVKSEEFVQGNVKDAAQLIQGKVAGLTISSPSGDPTEGSQVKLRGTSSLTGGTDPLVLVDGVPGNLNTVAPEDIESIDVLKDGSATAIYGTRGTNGVIIITTKKGNYSTKPTIDYNGYTSLSTIANKMNFLNASELREKYAEGYNFIGANVQDFGEDTDWLDLITRDALSQVHNLIFRGGNDVTNLTASLNYRDLEGIFIKSETEKYTGRISVNHAMFDKKLKTNVSIIASEQVYNALGDGTSFNPYIYRQAIIRNPTEPVRNEDGSWYERDVYFYDNPVGYIEETIGENRYRNLRLDLSLSYELNDNLEIKGLYTRKGNSNIRGFYQTKNHVSTVKYGQDGFASRGTDDYRGNYGQLTLDYKQTFGKHTVTGLLGYNYEDNVNEGFWSTNRRFPTDAFTYNNIGSGLGLQLGEAGMGSYKNSDKLIAFFGRITYNYDDRFLLLASLRHEGSSRFGDNMDGADKVSHPRRVKLSIVN
ncbi:SusC/RagA family TonB-linked outer membrane protein [Formosa sp. A9]|uniref:SusC/RagA family TonB-linked outer membrane protein n=1 Tax=Formosa sp. A9 TaxID=3442641 RepID=UPI003EBB8E0D